MRGEERTLNRTFLTLVSPPLPEESSRLRFFLRRFLLFLLLDFFSPPGAACCWGNDPRLVGEDEALVLVNEDDMASKR